MSAPATERAAALEADRRAWVEANPAPAPVRDEWGAIGLPAVVEAWGRRAFGAGFLCGWIQAERRVIAARGAADAER